MSRWSWTTKQHGGGGGVGGGREVNTTPLNSTQKLTDALGFSLHANGGGGGIIIIISRLCVTIVFCSVILLYCIVVPCVGRAQCLIRTALCTCNADSPLWQLVPSSVTIFHRRRQPNEERKNKKKEKCCCCCKQTLGMLSTATAAAAGT